MAATTTARGPWPQTEGQLLGAGYQPPLKFSRSKCRACGALIQFWTTPAGKGMPLTNAAGVLTPHWADCPGADDFRKPKEAKPRPVYWRITAILDYSGQKAI